MEDDCEPCIASLHGRVTFYAAVGILSLVGVAAIGLGLFVITRKVSKR